MRENLSILDISRALAVKCFEMLNCSPSPTTERSPCSLEEIKKSREGRKTTNKTSLMFFNIHIIIKFPSKSQKNK